MKNTKLITIKNILLSIILTISSIITPNALAESQYVQVMEELQNVLQDYSGETQSRGRKAKSPRKNQQKLAELDDALNQIDSEILQDFNKVESSINKYNLSPNILQRHKDAVEKYNKEFKTAKNNIKKVRQAKTDLERIAASDEALRHLKKFQHKRTKQPFDETELPFSVSKGKQRKPSTTKEEYRKASQAKNSQISRSIKQSKAKPTSENLSSTIDIHLTESIRALATSLNNDPVAIFNWTKNNIDFVPTYGSIQGASGVLVSRKANAIDTASFLQALLRSAGISTRYAHGTIEVPAENFINWLGVNSVQDGLQLLSQTGVPAIGSVKGGVLVAVRLEHVWVQGWIDIHPSRGSRHRKGDEWANMDASYKQFKYSDGMDIASNVPFNSNQFFDQVNQTIQTDAAGGITGIDKQLITHLFDNYQQQYKSYVNGIDSRANIGKVIGSRRLIKRKSPILGGLPYNLIVADTPFHTLPDSLRHTVTIKAYDTAQLQELDLIDLLDFSTLNYTISLPELNTKSLNVTAEPGRPEDQEAYDAFIASGEIEIPVYLFIMRTKIKLDGVVVAQGGFNTMGADQHFTAFLKGPNKEYHTKYARTVGDEMIFGIDGDGVNIAMIDDRIGRVDTTTAAENLHQASLHYWAEMKIYDDILAKITGVRKQRIPSIGIFASPISIKYSFGIPYKGSYQVREIDLARIALAIAAKDQRTFVDFMRQSGMRSSYLEGSIMDQIYGRPNGTSVSTAQLFIEANQQNIPIYRITEENKDIIDTELSISNAVRDSVRNAVNLGRTVYIPKQTMTHDNTWTGEGYIIQDPETGSAAYLISGGLRGMEQTNCLFGNKPISSSTKLTLTNAMNMLKQSGALMGALSMFGSMVTSLPPNFNELIMPLLYELALIDQEMISKESVCEVNIYNSNTEQLALGIPDEALNVLPIESTMIYTVGTPKDFVGTIEWTTSSRVTIEEYLSDHTILVRVAAEPSTVKWEEFIRVELKVGAAVIASDQVNLTVFKIDHFAGAEEITNELGELEFVGYMNERNLEEDMEIYPVHVPLGVAFQVKKAFDYDFETNTIVRAGTKPRPIDWAELGAIFDDVIHYTKEEVYSVDFALNFVPGGAGAKILYKSLKYSRKLAKKRKKTNIKSYEIIITAIAKPSNTKFTRQSIKWHGSTPMVVFSNDNEVTFTSKITEIQAKSPKRKTVTAKNDCPDWDTDPSITMSNSPSKTSISVSEIPNTKQEVLVTGACKKNGVVKVSQARKVTKDECIPVEKNSKGWTYGWLIHQDYKGELSFSEIDDVIQANRADKIKPKGLKNEFDKADKYYYSIRKEGAVYYYNFGKKQCITDTAKICKNYSDIKVNIDTGTLVALVSEGSQSLTGSLEVLRIEKWIGNKKMYMTRTADSEFANIITTIGGPNEQERAERLLEIIEIMPDNHSGQTKRLVFSDSNSTNDALVFGTAESECMLTVTSDGSFKARAFRQGVNFEKHSAYEAHNPVPLEKQ